MSIRTLALMPSWKLRMMASILGGPAEREKYPRPLRCDCESVMKEERRVTQAVIRRFHPVRRFP